MNKISQKDAKRIVDCAVIIDGIASRYGIKGTLQIVYRKAQEELQKLKEENKKER